MLKSNHRKSPRQAGTISMVQYLELFLHEIRDEMAKWRVILTVPYREYLTNK